MSAQPTELRAAFERRIARDREEGGKTTTFGAPDPLDVAALALLDKIERLEAEVARLRSILNEDGLYDPELAKLAGEPVNALRTLVGSDRTFTRNSHD